MKIEKKHLLDYTILIPYLILSVVGLIVVYSTTSARLVALGANPFASVINQGAFWLVSLFSIFFIYRLKLNFLRKDKLLGVVIAFEILLLVIAKFFTREINGANGWIVLGPLSFQPAEYLKIIVVWFLAHTFSKKQSAIERYDYQALTKNRWIPRNGKELNDWRVYLLVMIGLVAIQPDLGNAAIIVLTTVVMFSISGVGYRWFTALFAGIVGVSSAFLGLIALVGVQTMAKVPIFGYVAKRFAAYFNPFNYIQRDIQAETVATKIVQSENAEGKKDVWFSTQRQLLKALILFVMNHRSPEQRNLAGVTQVLQENDVEAEEKGADSPLDTLFLDLTMSDPARRAYELGFKKAKGEMKASIIESLLATISKFVDKEVANFTSFSDFDLKEIGKAKVVLYVIIPVMDNTYESFINLFFSQLFDELYKLAADHHAKLPHQVDFILDEFVNLGKFPKYEEFLATCRGYGIGVTTICQTLTQLQALYGKEKAESILGNHAVKICLNAANDVTAKYFSDLLGKSTVKVETGSESTSHSKEESHSKSDSYSYTSRSLMTPDEIMRMPEDQSLLIFSNARPVKATKAFQFKLFPGADKLVNLSQNEYQGQPEASQETNFHQRVEKWKAKLKETAQKKAANKMSQTEEEQQQDSLDSDLERVSNKDSQTEEPDDNLLG